MGLLSLGNNFYHKVRLNKLLEEIYDLLNFNIFDKNYNKYDVNLKINILIDKDIYDKLTEIKILLSDVNILCFKYSFNLKIKKLIYNLIILFNKKESVKLLNNDNEKELLNKIIDRLKKIRNDNNFNNTILNFFYIIIKGIKLLFSLLLILIIIVVNEFIKFDMVYYILKIIEFNGPVFIKLFQHLIEYKKYISFLEIFEEFKDNIREYINYHNYFYSENIIKKYNLDVEILDYNYKSGSMGQILKCKYKNKICALKIIHPNLEKEIYSTFYLLKIIVNIINYLYNIDLDLDSFYRSIIIQSNFNYEAKNNLKFKDNFQNYDNIIFPKIYYFNNDIIIYEFINFSDEKNLSKSSESKFLYIIAVYKMIFVDNFIHGDLHSGNWKIIVDKNSIEKIVFFDTSNYFTVDNIELLKKILYYNIIDNKEQEIFCILNFLGLNENKDHELVNKFINFKGRKINKYDFIHDYQKDLLLAINKEFNIKKELIYILNLLYSLRNYFLINNLSWIKTIKKIYEYKYFELLNIFIEFDEEHIIFNKEQLN